MPFKVLGHCSDIIEGFAFCFSLFRNPAEMSHTCRGTISLHGALIHTVDACTFVVSNGATQTFHIKAATEVERQQWVTALELAKAKAIQAMESGIFLCQFFLNLL